MATATKKIEGTSHDRPVERPKICLNAYCMQFRTTFTLVSNVLSKLILELYIGSSFANAKQF